MKQLPFIMSLSGVSLNVSNSCKLTKHAMKQYVLPVVCAVSHENPNSVIFYIVQDVNPMLSIIPVVVFLVVLVEPIMSHS